jgi:hypothetical protein
MGNLGLTLSKSAPPFLVSAIHGTTSSCDKEKFLNKEFSDYARGFRSIPHSSLTVSSDETNWIPRKPYITIYVAIFVCVLLVTLCTLDQRTFVMSTCRNINSSVPIFATSNYKKTHVFVCEYYVRLILNTPYVF